MLSMRAKYGLKAVIRLAREQESQPMLISDLASKERIPKKFLELILLDLKNIGILGSRKGRGGGYYLAKAPEAITLGTLVRHLNGPLALVPCVSQSAYQKCTDCEDERTCGIRIVMKEVHDATVKILDGTTLADVVRQIDQAVRAQSELLMYCI